MIDRAEERMRAILQTHKPEPMPPGADAEIDRILAEARRYYKKKGLL
jgi:hypothetical protein